MSGLPFVVHGLTLALAWFLLVNVAACLVVAEAARRLIARGATASQGVWLGLRLFPAAVAALFVAALFLPSYWEFEPREFVEGFDITLTSLAVVALVVLASGAARGILAWRRASRRAGGWMATAKPLAIDHAGIAAFTIESPTPLMALVGVFRPRLLVARTLLDALTAEELAASVAHEVGHWRAWDNLKRLAMRAAPDLLTTTCTARAIERRWTSASEHAADRRATGGAPARCALASALVKAARLIPADVPTAEPICTLISGGDIASRVESLLDDTAPAASTGRHAAWLALVAAIPAVVLAADYTPLLQLVHAATEVLVNRLP